MLRTKEVKIKGYESVTFLEDKKIGMRGYVAIHDTSLGPAVGGCRMLKYDNQNLALKDALRLSRGMTYKSAAVGLNYGGGKTVIIANDVGSRREMVFERLGSFINDLGGTYITGVDAGTNLYDMKFLKRHTEYVAGVPSPGHEIGDPSMATAYGVYMGMKACIKEKLGRRDFQDLRVSIQGAGKVGGYLIERLTKEGSKIILAEPREEIAQQMAQEFGVDLVKPNQIYNVEADIFAPCALGGMLNSRTIPRLKSPIVAGAANNQLLTDKAGELLHTRNILYAPDYVINAGGLICVVLDMEGSNMANILLKTSRIYDTLLDVFRTSKSEDLPPYLVADRMAERKIIKANTDKEKEKKKPEDTRTSYGTDQERTKTTAASMHA